jgi:hypothetical protein
MLAQPAPGSLALAWPAWAVNCSLYAATNLLPPVLWSPVTNPVTSRGGSNAVALPVDAGARFFQLRGP